MLHTYIDKDLALAEQIKNYREKQGKIVIAFNFNTVHFNEVGTGENYDKVGKVLRKLCERGAILYCYEATVDKNHHLDHPEVEKALYLLNLDASFCEAYPVEADFIVDQRAGLAQVYEELKTLCLIEMEEL